MPLHATLLLIDNEPRLRQLLARILQLEGYTVLEAENARAGLKTLERETVHVVICDVKLPDGNGVELTGRFKQLKPATEVIVLTAHGTIADGVLAIKNGAFDYITKGDDNDKIIPLVSRAVDKAHLQFRIQQLEEQVHKRHGFDSILGRSVRLYNMWYSPVALVRYKTSDKTWLAGRFEYYEDKRGVVIGTANGFQTLGYSVNYDYAILLNRNAGSDLFRVEAKIYNSKGAIFESGSGLSRTNTSLTTSFAISF